MNATDVTGPCIAVQYRLINAYMYVVVERWNSDMTENWSDGTLNYGRFGSLIGKLKPNHPTVFLRPLLFSAFSLVIYSLHCWLGNRKDIWPLKMIQLSSRGPNWSNSRKEGQLNKTCMRVCCSDDSDNKQEMLIVVIMVVCVIVVIDFAR